METLTSLEVGKLWDDNADLWMETTSKGYDPHRDFVQRPAFFSILPDVCNLAGLDVGCGDGECTAMLANQGASMVGIDISEKFINSAKVKYQEDRGDIQFTCMDAGKLSLLGRSFDFVTSFSALMDIPNMEGVVQQVYSSLRSGGFFQFSITHPCFWSHNLNWAYSGEKKLGLICSDYFNKNRQRLSSWMFEGVSEEALANHEKKTFCTPLFHRTLSEWLNALTEVGFVLECAHEPTVGEELVMKYPALEGHRIVPYFLILRVRKP